MSKESTSTFDSKPLSLIIQIPYILIMLDLGIPRTLFFKSSNITDFLDRYEQMYNNFRVEIIEKIKKLSWNCKMFIGISIERVIQSSEIIWATIYKML